MDPKHRREMIMFGCTERVLRSMYENSMVDPGMLTASILSDCQELIDIIADQLTQVDHVEKMEIVRQYLNRAKYGIMTYLRPALTGQEQG